MDKKTFNTAKEFFYPYYKNLKTLYFYYQHTKTYLEEIVYESESVVAAQ